MKEPFRPDPSAYARAEAPRVLRIFFPIVSVLMAASAVGALFDIRFLFAGLMIVMVLCPAAFFFLWFGMTGRQDARLRLRPQVWHVSPTLLRIEFFGFGEDAPVESEIEIPMSEIERFERRGAVYLVCTTHADCNLLLADIEHLDAESVKILATAAFEHQNSRDDEELA